MCCSLICSSGQNYCHRLVEAYMQSASWFTAVLREPCLPSLENIPEPWVCRALRGWEGSQWVRLTRHHRCEKRSHHFYLEQQCQPSGLWLRVSGTLNRRRRGLGILCRGPSGRPLSLHV